jgi:hypothetical protein
MIQIGIGEFQFNFLKSLFVGMPRVSIGDF